MDRKRNKIRPKNPINWDYQEPAELSEEKKVKLLADIWKIVGIEGSPSITDYYDMNKTLLEMKLCMKFAEKHYRSIFE